MCELCLPLVAAVTREMTDEERRRWATRHLRRTLALVGLEEARQGEHLYLGRSSPTRAHARVKREVQWPSAGRQ